MLHLIQAMVAYLNGVRRVGAIALEQVTLDALESFEDLVKQVMTVTIVVMVAALTISGLLGAALAALEGPTIIAKIFLALVVLAYFALMFWLLRSGNALRSAGLLIGVDLAYGIAKTGVPISPNDFQNIVRLNFDDDRLRRLASLQLAARTLFDIVIFETLMLLAFSFVGIWTHPGWAIILLVTAFVSAILYTPFGQNGKYKGFAPLLLVISIAIYGMMAWSEILTNWEYIYSPFAAWRWWQFVLLIIATSITLAVLNRSDSGRVKFWAKMVAVPLLILGLYGWMSCLSYGISEMYRSAVVSADGNPKPEMLELPTPPPITNKIDDKQFHIVVPANVLWYDSGVDIGGRKYKIEVSKGKWEWDFTPGHICAGEGWGKPYPGTIVPSAPLAGLVGKTDKQPGFFVGNSYAGVAPVGSGTLKLSLNDKEDSFKSGNQGSLDVTLTFLE